MSIFSHILSRHIRCLVFLGIFWTLPTWGQIKKAPPPVDKDIIMDADFLERNAKTGLSVLKGNVQVIFQGQILNCDEAVVDSNNFIVEAEGNIRLQSPTSYLEGERVRLNYKTQEGTIYNGFVKSGQILFEGEVIQRISESEYIADHATYTSCTTCPPAWDFSGKKIKAKMGNYAFISHPILRFAKVPVFWLPYLVVPLKSERQTGMLIPIIDHTGSGGMALSLRYFWAINRSQDATFTLKGYTKRGLQGLVNYRYKLSPTSQGDFNFGMLRDQAIKTEPRLLTRQGQAIDRWFLKYKHFYDLPNGFTQTADLNLVSDLLYPTNFPDDITGGDPALLNRIGLTKNGEITHLSLNADYYVNLVKENILAGNEDAVHRAPEMRMNFAERRVLGSDLLFRMDNTFTNFARSSWSYDDVTTLCPPGQTKCLADEALRDGKFNAATDLPRAGYRLDSHPILTGALKAGRYFDITPSVGYRFTQYHLNINSPDQSDYNTSPNRQYLQTQLTFRNTSSRIYQFDSDVAADGTPIERAYKHQIQTSLSGSTIPYFNQTASPFFGNTSAISATQANQPLSDQDFLLKDGRGIQFDTSDQVWARRLLTLSLDNTITKKERRGEITSYKQIAFMRLSQSYDFLEERRAVGTQPWSPVQALVDLRFENFNTNTVVEYFPYLNVSNTSARVRINDSLQNYVQLSFNQIFVIPAKVSDFNYLNRSENYGVGMGTQYKYIAVGGEVDYSNVIHKLNSWTVYTTLIPPGDCWSIRTTVRALPNSRDIQYKFAFDFSFGGGNNG